MTKINDPWLTDPATQAVLSMLESSGAKAYAVGGCVRNALLGEPVNDIDIATSAVPNDVMKLAESAGLKAIPTGIDHGTITVVSDGTPFEITTFRRDVSTDGRHAVVAYTDDLTQDAERRDFTMNAIYAAADGTVIDPLSGLPDLKARRLRFIADPDKRIEEDHLRSLRFFRFHAQYADPQGGFDPDALAAIATHLDGLDQLSGERITSELMKLLAAEDPAASIAACRQTGALGRILAGADDRYLGPLVHLENGILPDPIRRLATLGGDTARLRLSKANQKQLSVLRENIGSNLSASTLGYLYGMNTAQDILLLKATMFEQPIMGFEDAEFGAAQKFPVKAKDLMPSLEGKALGDRLKSLETEWIDSGFKLTKAELLK
jgi:poly(A) polymerase